MDSVVWLTSGIVQPTQWSPIWQSGHLLKVLRALSPHVSSSAAENLRALRKQHRKNGNKTGSIMCEMWSCVMGYIISSRERWAGLGTRLKSWEFFYYEERCAALIGSAAEWCRQNGSELVNNKRMRLFFVYFSDLRQSKKKQTKNETAPTEYPSCATNTT